MGRYRTGLTLTLPEFDTHNTLKRFAEEHTAESKLAFLWLKRRAQNALAWQALSVLPVDVIDKGMELRVGTFKEAAGEAETRNKGLDLKELVNMPQDKQMELYLAACKNAGVEIDVEKLKQATGGV